MDIDISLNKWRRKFTPVTVHWITKYSVNKFELKYFTIPETLNLVSDNVTVHSK